MYCTEVRLQIDRAQSDQQWSWMPLLLRSRVIAAMLREISGEGQGCDEHGRSNSRAILRASALYTPTAAHLCQERLDTATLLAKDVDERLVDAVRELHKLSADNKGM